MKMKELVIRRADGRDADEVSSLFRTNARDFFPNDTDRDETLQKSLISQALQGDVLLKSLLCMSLTYDGRIVAFVSFNDTPRNEGLPASENCLDLVRHSQHCQGAGPANTLYLTSWACESAFETEAIELVMKTLFHTMPEVDFVLAICHSLGKARESLNNAGFKKVTAFENKTGHSEGKEQDGDSWVVQCCPRVAYRPNLRPRLAEVEDYDDLVKIFEAQSKVLTQTYGEYFLAELIECQNEENKAITATFDEIPVGLLCLSTNIDIDLLLQSFELDAFDDFGVKPQSEDESKGGETRAGNVFAITLFCVDDQHKSRTRDLLVQAFECFPECDYCALTLPNDIYESALLPYFFPIPIREGSNLSHSLYILHRDSLRAIQAMYMMTPSSVEAGEESKASEYMSMVPEWVGGSQMEVVYLESGEMERIEDLVQGVETCKEIMQDVSRSADYQEISTMLVKILGQIVGVVVVESYVDNRTHDQEVQRLDHMFDIRSVKGIPKEIARDASVRHGTILHFVLVPIFNQFSRGIFRELMRKMEIQVLHYKMRPGTRPPISVVEEMVQVRPRRMFHLERSHRKRHLDTPKCKDSRFALFTLTKSTLTEPRLVVNTRVVVVGASETGLAVLEELLLVPHVYYPKITLVAPGGIPDERYEGLRQLCTEGSAAPGAYDSRYLERLALKDRITVIDDRMVYLERDAQAVVLADGSLLEYDYLVLATGLQDTALSSACNLSVLDIKNQPRLMETAYSVHSDARHATSVRQSIQHKHSLSEGQCIVYGSTIESYSAVQALMQWGKPGSFITFILDTASQQEAEDKVFADDEWMKSRMREYLQASGVKICCGLKLAGVERERERVRKAFFIKTALEPQSKKSSALHLNGGVVSATGKARELETELMQSNASSLKGFVQGKLGDESKERDQEEGEQKYADDDFEEFPCELLITATDKNIDPDIFASINDTGLVYDGKMVVNASFQTVDPRIYGAGTHTKFSRKYKVKHTMDKFNSREVGVAVASSLLNVIDPLRIDESSRSRKQPPTFSMPKLDVHASELPGNIRYFRASRPGWDSRSKMHKVLETATEDAFCKLVVDQYQRIASVSFGLSREYFQIRNEDDGDKTAPQHIWSLKNRLTPLHQLIGLHVSFLNDVEAQLGQGEVKDLYEFLSRDWAGALYHDTFGQFMTQLQRTMSNPGNWSEMDESQRQQLQQTVDSLTKEYGNPKNEDVDLIVKRNEFIGPCGLNLNQALKRSIQNQCLDFLQQNKTILEMYHLGE